MPLMTSRRSVVLGAPPSGKEGTQEFPLGFCQVGEIGFSGEGLVHGIAFVENSLGKATQFPQNVQDQLPILPKLRRALLDVCRSIGLHPLRINNPSAINGWAGGIRDTVSKKSCSTMLSALV